MLWRNFSPAKAAPSAQLQAQAGDAVDGALHGDGIPVPHQRLQIIVQEVPQLRLQRRVLPLGEHLCGSQGRGYQPA